MNWIMRMLRIWRDARSMRSPSKMVKRQANKQIGKHVVRRLWLK